MVEYLIENGALMHARDRYGHTALDDAVRLVIFTPRPCGICSYVVREISRWWSI